VNRRDDPMLRAVRQTQARKEAARREGRRSVGHALGLFGIVGWSVALPTVLGIAVGVWLDRRDTPGVASWTLTLLLAGVALGCLAGGYWVWREANRA